MKVPCIEDMVWYGMLEVLKRYPGDRNIHLTRHYVCISVLSLHWLFLLSGGTCYKAWS